MSARWCPCVSGCRRSPEPAAVGARGRCRTVCSRSPARTWATPRSASPGMFPWGWRSSTSLSWQLSAAVATAGPVRGRCPRSCRRRICRRRRGGRCSTSGSCRFSSGVCSCRKDKAVSLFRLGHTDFPFYLLNDININIVSAELFGG